MERLPGCKGCSGVCHRCHKHADDAYYGCDCDEPLLMEDIPMSAEYNEDGTIKLPDAGASEPVNDPGAFEQPADEAQEIPEQVEGDEQPIAFAVHLILLQNGQFALQATGEPNIGEMNMLLARGLDSVRARMIAETVAQILKEQNKPESRIITPGR